MFLTAQESGVESMIIGINPLAAVPKKEEPTELYLPWEKHPWKMQYHFLKQLILAKPSSLWVKIKAGKPVM
ncbi:hypothetical protein LWM68_00940 [Niabella sp. W65]|nr:hypothetical protein [Niabella sp. W65]MCH7361472.1 hypothetical protein [Niabella sp. W65]